MYLEVESQSLVRKGVQRLQGILDWYGDSVRSRWYGFPPSIQVSLLYARAEEPQAPAGSGSKDASSSPSMPRVPRTKEPLNQVQTVFLHYIATGTLPAAHSQYTLSDMQQQLLEQFQKTPHFFGAPSGGSVFSDQLLDLLLNKQERPLPRLLLPRLWEAPFGRPLRPYHGKRHRQPLDRLALRCPRHGHPDPALENPLTIPFLYRRTHVPGQLSESRKRHRPLPPPGNATPPSSFGLGRTIAQQP